MPHSPRSTVNSQHRSAGLLRHRPSSGSPAIPRNGAFTRSPSTFFLPIALPLPRSNPASPKARLRDRGQHSTIAWHSLLSSRLAGCRDAAKHRPRSLRHGRAFHSPARLWPGQPPKLLVNSTSSFNRHPRSSAQFPARATSHSAHSAPRSGAAFTSRTAAITFARLWPSDERTASSHLRSTHPRPADIASYIAMAPRPSPTRAGDIARHLPSRFVACTLCG